MLAHPILLKGRSLFVALICAAMKSDRLNLRVLNQLIGKSSLLADAAEFVPPSSVLQEMPSVSYLSYHIVSIIYIYILRFFSVS